MSNVLHWRGITRHRIPPDQLLAKALGECETVLILGYDKQGEFYFASSEPDGGSVLWLLEWAKKELLKTAEEMSP